MIELEKINEKRHYVLVLDTETTNTIQDGDKLDMSNVLVYDCGWQVVDICGNIYLSASYVNEDIFVHEKELMQCAYYADKISQYVADIEAGTRKLANTYNIRKAMLEDMEKYGITEVVAHNAYFDLNALNCTQRYVSKSEVRYWFPYGITILDTMKMASSTICKMPAYKAFCEKYGYLTKTGKVRKTAEILWRFISGNNDFVESHTGLEDVEIEAQIMAYCIKQNKYLDKELFPNQKKISHTKFQVEIMRSIKETPVLARV